MDKSINERIKLLLDELGYKSKRAFAAKIGVSQTSFNDIINGAEPKYTTLFKIMNAEPLTNAEWLLTGKGNMLKSENQISEKNIDYREKYEEVNKKYVELLEENRELSNENRNLHKQLEIVKKGKEYAET